jgi:hypothetical protein
MKVWGPVLVAAGFHAALLACYVAAFGGDPGILVCVGSEHAGRPPYEAIARGLQKTGYDGQFYYAIARSPWGRHEAELDCAARQVRILYPALSWLLSGGDVHRLLWAMPLVNLLAVAGLTGLGARLALRHGWSPWWAVLLPLAVNVAMPLLRDLTDVLSTLTVCGLLVSWLLGGRWWALSLWAAAAVFCREQNVALVLVVLLAAAWRHRLRTCAGLGAVLALWGAWVCTLRGMYGTWPFLDAQGHLGMPLGGMLLCWRPAVAGSRTYALFHDLGLLLVLAEIALAVYLVVRPRVDPVLVLATLAGAALAALGGVALYEDRWSYTRVFAWLPLGIGLACLQTRWRWPLIGLSTSVLLPLAAVAKAWMRAV